MTNFIIAALVTATLILVGTFSDTSPVRIIEEGDPYGAARSSDTR